ncbi:heparinase II/III domain-containing protein [Cellulomonas hominis]|uniref:heparinase II/III domain-containing protein n=1 Tax=Cellulomonas hominis TaxID=156981 RepID=UPI001443BCC1|nr:heparinase II/III family protein [Cellulomonas hominis]NKY09735.1 hypothetical protein [Cellulomonas hominis]
MVAYLNRRYSDFTPSGWGASGADGVFLLRFPNAYEMRLDESSFPINWHVVFEYNHVTTRLWHRSLCWLLPLADLDGGWRVVGRVVGELRSLLEVAETSPSILGMNSLDHAIALELRTACTLRAKLAADERLDDAWRADVDAALRTVVAMLESHARAAGFRLANNHGLMLGLALLHSALVFPDVPRAPEATQSDVEDLREAVEVVVDVEGFVFENTPQYQRLYIDILEQLVELVAALQLQGDSRAHFSARRDALLDTYRRMLTAERTVPAIGDAPRSKDWVHEPILGTLFSAANGLYVRTEEQGQLSISCGTRSPVHKQMDDTAVRMALGEVDLILDAGLLSYDSHDPVASGVRAQPGHSGLFFTDFDDRPAFWFYPADAPAKVDASMRLEAGTLGDRLTCRYVVGGVHEALRVVDVRSVGSLSVTDRCFGPDGAAAVQRFLLPGDMRITVAGGAVRATTDAADLTLTADEGIRSWCIRRGWSATRPGPPEPCWVLESSVRGGNAVVTHVEGRQL